MGLVGNCYVYWDDLLGLSGTSFKGPFVVPGPSSSPINLPHLSSFLSHYPECRLASYILLGIRDGFHVGLAAPVTIRSSSRNHPSCQSCLGVITDTLQQQGRPVACQALANSGFLASEPDLLSPKEP